MKRGFFVLSYTIQLLNNKFFVVDIYSNLVNLQKINAHIQSMELKF
jgi:hypothetical protein